MANASSAKLTNDETTICRTHLCAVRDRLNDSTQFEALITMGVNRVGVWTLEDLDRNSNMPMIALELDPINISGDDCRQVIRTALGLLRDALNNEPVFNELVAVRGVRSFLLPFPPEVLNTALTNQDDVMIYSHTETFESNGGKNAPTDTDWVIRRVDGKPTIVYTS